jgi:hypothetical protein
LTSRSLRGNAQHLLPLEPGLVGLRANIGLRTRISLQSGGFERLGHGVCAHASNDSRDSCISCNSPPGQRMGRACQLRKHAAAGVLQPAMVRVSFHRRGNGSDEADAELDELRATRRLAEHGYDATAAAAEKPCENTTTGLLHRGAVPAAAKRREQPREAERG